MLLAYQALYLAFILAWQVVFYFYLLLLHNLVHQSGFIAGTILASWLILFVFSAPLQDFPDNFCLKFIWLLVLKFKLNKLRIKINQIYRFSFMQSIVLPILNLKPFCHFFSESVPHKELIPLHFIKFITILSIWLREAFK